MDELIHYSHRMVYTNQTTCWDPIETERSEAPDTPGDSMITVTGGSKRPCTPLKKGGGGGTGGE